MSNTTNAPLRKASQLPMIAGAIAIALLVAAASSLLMTNSNQSWSQGYDPMGHWWLSTILAVLPVATLLGTLALLKVKAHISSLSGLVAALLIAMLFFHMPVRMALTSAVYGAGFGLFPICWIVLPVIFLYKLTIKAGRFDMLKQSLTNITADSRLQLLLIAFAFGAFFEGAAGFGTPVAVCGAILLSLGFRPLQAAGLALLANTAPVAFGGLGIPIVALTGVTGLNAQLLTVMVARLLVPFCILVPFWLIWAFVGFRKMLEVWPAILVAGVTFGVTQWAVATFNGPALVDIIASVTTIVVFVGFLKVWKPCRILNAQGEDITATVARAEAISLGDLWRAWMPWITLSAVIYVWGMDSFQHLVNSVTLKFPVNGLDKMVLRVPPVVIKPTFEAAVFKLDWLAATGTGITVAAILAGLLMGLSLKSIVTTFFRTVYEIRFSMLTIASMLALGYVTRYCGLDATLGLAFARTGTLYPFFGTLVGWLGTASTGSDTSSNVLFGGLQKMTAQQIGVSPILMASANSSGAVMAKMMAAQSIVVATTATQNYGGEGSILRFVFPHSIALACLSGLLTYLVAYYYPFTMLIVH